MHARYCARNFTDAGISLWLGLFRERGPFEDSAYIMYCFCVACRCCWFGFFCCARTCSGFHRWTLRNDSVVGSTKIFIFKCFEFGGLRKETFISQYAENREVSDVFVLLYFQFRYVCEMIRYKVYCLHAFRNQKEIVFSIKNSDNVFRSFLVRNTLGRQRKIRACCHKKIRLW